MSRSSVTDMIASNGCGVGCPFPCTGHATALFRGNYRVKSKRWLLIGRRRAASRPCDGRPDSRTASQIKRPGENFADFRQTAQGRMARASRRQSGRFGAFERKIKCRQT
jgi:hypothetical protein